MVDVIFDPDCVTFGGVFVHLTVNGRLYTAAELQLKSVIIIDAEEGDNTVEFSCIDNDFHIADNTFFREGAVLSLRWGYTVPKLFSEERYGYVIMKPSTDYTKDGVVSTIKAKTKSATLGAHRPARSYGKVSLYQVVSDIAAKAQLHLEMTHKKEMLDGFAQGNWSDRQVLRVLSERFGYQLSFTSESIIFKPVEYGDDPKITLRYGRGGNMHSANVNNDTQSDLGAGTKVTERGFDPAQKAPVVETSKPGDFTGKVLGIFGGNGHSWWTTPSPLAATPPAGSAPAGAPGSASPLPKVVMSAPPGGKAVGSSKEEEGMDAEMIRLLRSSPETTSETLKSHADATRAKGKKKKAGLSCQTVGIPTAKARIIVTVVGLSVRDAGNWRVSQVAHKIDTDSSSYTCDWELNRPNKGVGSKRDEGVANDKKAPGAESKSKNTQIRVSAINGNVGKG